MKNLRCSLRLTVLSACGEFRPVRMVISYDVWIDDITNCLLLCAFQDGLIGRKEVGIPLMDWTSKSPEDRQPLIDAAFANARLLLLEEAA